MNGLNVVSFIFLVVLFVLTPRAALRSARLLRRLQEAGQEIPRRRLVLSAMFGLSVLWAISAINATMLGASVFAVPRFGGREAAVGMAGLALLLAIIPISISLETPGEEARNPAYILAPRNGREMALFVLVAIMAGVAEEAAYRGVAVWILAPVFGNLLPAMLLSAMAFAVAHAVQGGRAMAIAFAVAALFHAVVYLTGTLVVAMVAHTVYDIVAGYAAGQRARALAAEVTPTPK